MRTIVKYILLEVFSYGPHVTEATFTAIGRMPRSRPDLMKPMIVHDLSEVDHGEMALRDYIRLGGNEKYTRSRRITPESFCMSAVRSPIPKICPRSTLNSAISPPPPRTCNRTSPSATWRISASPEPCPS